MRCLNKTRNLCDILYKVSGVTLFGRLIENVAEEIDCICHLWVFSIIIFNGAARMRQLTLSRSMIELRENSIIDW